MAKTLQDKKYLTQILLVACIVVLQNLLFLKTLASYEMKVYENFLGGRGFLQGSFIIIQVIYGYGGEIMSQLEQLSKSTMK